jgi:hypothetical protein
VTIATRPLKSNRLTGPSLPDRAPSAPAVVRSAATLAANRPRRDPRAEVNRASLPPIGSPAGRIVGGSGRRSSPQCRLPPGPYRRDAGSVAARLAAARTRARSNRMIVASRAAPSVGAGGSGGRDSPGLAEITAGGDERGRSRCPAFASHHGSSQGATMARHRPQTSPPYHTEPSATHGIGIGGTMTTLTADISRSLAPEW